jgi:hypothetical protein
MECPGSNALLDKLGFTQDTDEPDWQREGTAAHDLIARCLNHTDTAGQEAWEWVGEIMENGEVITADLAIGAQVMIDECVPIMHGADQVWVEERITSGISKYYYGTVDFAALHGTYLQVRDFKNGAGVVVEVEWNPQFLYYAWGIAESRPDIEVIQIGVVQPNAYHPDGPVRTWTLTRDQLRKWIYEKLMPAMHKAMHSHDLKPGEWCRFCPAKLICPVLTGLFRAAATIDPEALGGMSDADLDRDYALIEAVQMRLRAIKNEVFSRLSHGREFTEAKLVPKQADRVFRGGAEDVLVEKLGADNIYTKPRLKSPAEIEKLTGGKALVKELAYTPDTGLTVVPTSNKRHAVVVKPITEKFKRFTE